MAAPDRLTSLPRRLYIRRVEFGAAGLPGPDVNDDASLRAYLRQNLSTYAHPGGTCRFGTDADAVVGTDLRVHGISGPGARECQGL